MLLAIVDDLCLTDYKDFELEMGTVPLGNEHLYNSMMARRDDSVSMLLPWQQEAIIHADWQEESINSIMVYDDKILVYNKEFPIEDGLPIHLVGPLTEYDQLLLEKTWMDVLSRRKTMLDAEDKVASLKGMVRDEYAPLDIKKLADSIPPEVAIKYDFIRMIQNNLTDDIHKVVANARELLEYEEGELKNGDVS